MEQRKNRRGTRLIRPSAVEFSQSRPHLQAQVMSPADGSVAQSEGNVSVYCAPCQRWVDCYADIAPEIVLSRHVALVHTA